MARSRNIKPSIMDNEDLAALPALTRLLFIYMWMLADRDGRLEDRPSRIKKQALGYDDGSADDMLNELALTGFIERYEAQGTKVIQILAFTKHQTPHVREAASELPCKDTGTTKAVPSTNQGSAEPSPRSPDSGFLIPDTPYLIPDSLGESAPAKRTPPTKPVIAKPDDVSEQTWADWLKLRKSKKAPVTLTVVDGAKGEADKAGMTLEEFLRVWCRRGSQGLEASWLKGNERAPPTETPYQRSKRELFEAATGRKPGNAIDITPITLEMQ